MDPVRIAIGCAAPLPAGVAPDGRWSPPGLDGVEVVFTGRHDPDADDWTSVPARPGDDDRRLTRDLARVGWDRVDCYVGDIAEYRPLPADARAVSDRVALLVGDWNMGGQLLQHARGIVDAVCCDHAGVEAVTSLGHVALPTLVWGVRPEWPWVDPTTERDIDVLFIGSTNPAIHARRNGWLLRLGELADRAHVVIRSRLYGPAYREHMARAKLVFNHSVRGEANIRSYEGPVAGACVLNERGNVELPHVAQPDVDFATYDSTDLEHVVLELLRDDERRLRIAAAGQAAVRAHTIEAHVADRVRQLRDWIRTAPATPAPDAWHRFVRTQWQLATSLRAWRALDVPGDPTDHVHSRARARAGMQVSHRTHRRPSTGALDAAAHMVDEQASPRPGDLLVHADLLHAAATPPHIVLPVLQRAAATVSDPTAPETWIAAGWSAWRRAAEAAALDAADPTAHARACDALARDRARYELAAALGGQVEPRAQLDLLAPVTAPVVDVHLARGVLLGHDGRHAAARAELQLATDASPLDASTWRAWADACVASGDVVTARDRLTLVARSLGAMPDLEDSARAVRAKLRALPDSTAPSALLLVDPMADHELLDSTLAWWQHGPPGPRTLRIACVAPADGAQLVDAVHAALDRCAIDPDSLPDTEVVGAIDPSRVRWEVGASALVVGTPGSVAADHALDLRVEVLDPVATRAPGS